MNITSSNPFDYSYAPRTDSGVSASGNAFTLLSPLQPGDLIHYLNTTLESIIFHSYAHVPEYFNPRHASGRWYYYIIPTVELPSGSLGIQTFGKLIEFDPSLTERASSLFIGTHDFTSFSRLEPGKDPIRTLTSTPIKLEEIISGLPPMIVIDVKGESYLRMMVRFIIGAIIHVISSSWSCETISGSLSDPDPTVKPTPVSPHQLVLMDVHYAGIAFCPLSNLDRQLTKTSLDIIQTVEIWRNLIRTNSM